jgi:hypothetical protein
MARIIVSLGIAGGIERIIARIDDPEIGCAQLAGQPFSRYQ